MSDLDGFSLLVVDDHPLFREGLRLALLSLEPSMHVHAVDSALAAKSALVNITGQGGGVDLVLLDYRLPGDDGIACAQHLRAHFPQVAYAIMSGADDARLPTRVREAGLMGFFPKTLDATQLLDGLRLLSQGQSHFASLQPLSLPAPEHDPLTPRQREILAMVARGATNKEIAQVLQIAPHTVKNHLGQIFDRLGAANRAQAVSFMQTGSAELKA